MCDMRASLRELRRRTGAVVERVIRSEVVVIEKRGNAVAEMRPARPSAAGFPDSHWKAVEQGAPSSSAPEMRSNSFQRDLRDSRTKPAR